MKSGRKGFFAGLIRVCAVLASFLGGSMFALCVPEFAMMSYLHRRYGYPLQNLGDRAEFIGLHLVTVPGSLVFGILCAAACDRIVLKIFEPPVEQNRDCDHEADT
jgi:hypothetical protein